ncbi:MAG: ABC transporter ATP-binding protein [Desulfitobacteriaceae bacterium]|nr:ABC transporter ATP-binding protein [Desulfitobacteriaceae bacterium]MDI6915356.1 ABC transporter ATP-binding protein [Desulfitobacteriaceae bacterium]
MNVIETNNLTKSYGKARGIVDVNLAVKEGEIFGFIGPNGSGKSTTIRTLLAFIYPNSGGARIFGKDCFTQSAAIKREVGYLPAEVNYYDDMKVRELFAYSAKFYGKEGRNGKVSMAAVFDKAVKARIESLSDRFEVELGKRIDSLSLGNKKKVAIIQALLHEPKLLILDEPTGGLDPLMQNRFFELLKEENGKGTTIFLSSHILSEVERMCDRVAIIKEGRILQVESVEKLRNNKFKKIKVELRAAEIGQAFELPGMTNRVVKHGQVEFLYNGRINDIIQRLAAEDVANVLIEEPSLEEVFMHYYEK